MPRVPRFLCREQLTLEPYAGATAHGETWSSAVSPKPRAFVEPTNRLVKVAGVEEVATAIAIVCPPAPAFPVRSRVTRADGSVYRVLSAGAWPLGAGTEVLLGGMGATS